MPEIRPRVAVGLGQHPPVGERALQPIAPHEEFFFLLQPADQQRPDAEQRLVRHLDIAGAVALAQHQQARLRAGQCRHQPLGTLGQRIPVRRLTDETSLVVDLDEAGDEGLAQRLQLLLAWLDVFDHPGSGVAHHGFERRQAGSRIAQALIFDELETAIAAELVVEAAQRKGDQRQRVGGARILHDARDEALLDREIGDARRAADDLAHALDGQRAQRELLELGRQPRRRLQLAEMIGAHRRHGDEGQARPQHLRQEAEELLRARLLGTGEQLLHLVDGDQHAGAVRVVRLADAARQIFRIGVGERIGGDVDAGVAQAGGKPGEGVVLGPEDRQNDPLALGPLHTRHQAGAEQRRLARARLAEHHDEAPATLDTARIEALDQAADVVVAAEIDRRVVLIEGEEAGIRCPAGGEIEAALAEQRHLGQPVRQAFQPVLLVLGEVDLLQVVADILVAVRRDDDRKDRLAARACLGELGETPLGIEPVAGQQQDDRFGAFQLLVEGLFPLGARRDAVVRIDVKETTLEALRLEPIK